MYNALPVTLQLAYYGVLMWKHYLPSGANDIY